MYGAGLRLLRFFFLKRIIALTVLLREQLFHGLRRLTGNILHGNALADIGGIVRMALRGVDVQIPDELVVDDKALGLIFARPLRFVHVDVVDELVELVLIERFQQLRDHLNAHFRLVKLGRSRFLLALILLVALAGKNFGKAFSSGQK